MSEYISTTQAAEIMGVSRVTVFNMIKDGRIKSAIKVGRNYIIPKDFQRDFVKDIAKKIIPVLKKHDVKKADIFGSRACASEHKNSDLDLLIEYKKTAHKSLLDMSGLQLELEDLLKMKIDLNTYDAIRHPLLQKIIFNQMVNIL